MMPMYDDGNDSVDDIDDNVSDNVTLMQMLRATGKPYHPRCFTCVVCGKNLDGLVFTVDATNQIHCIEDFHRSAFCAYIFFAHVTWINNV